MDDYSLKAQKLETETFNLRRDPTSWTYLKKQNGVEIFYKPSPHFKGNVYKFIAAIDAPYEMVYDVMKPPITTEGRLSWDKSIKHYERLQTITEDIAIGLIITHPAAMGMISQREFIDLYFFKIYEEDQLQQDYGKMCWIFAQSVEYPGRPITKQYVRATNYPAGYAVAQNKRDPEKSVLELYVNCDVGGMIPRSLIEAALPSQQVAYIQSINKETRRRMNQMKN